MRILNKIASFLTEKVSEIFLLSLALLILGLTTSFLGCWIYHCSTSAAFLYFGGLGIGAGLIFILMSIIAFFNGLGGV